MHTFSTTTSICFLASFKNSDTALGGPLGHVEHVGGTETKVGITNEDEKMSPSGEAVTTVCARDFYLSTQLLLI